MFILFLVLLVGSIYYYLYGVLFVFLGVWGLISCLFMLSCLLVRCLIFVVIAISFMLLLMLDWVVLLFYKLVSLVLLEWFHVLFVGGIYCCIYGAGVGVISCLLMLSYLWV